MNMIFFITNKEPELHQNVASSSSQKRSTSAPTKEVGSGSNQRGRLWLQPKRSALAPTKEVGSEPAMERPTPALATEVGSGTNQKRFNRRFLKLIILFNSIDKKKHLD